MREKRQKATKTPLWERVANGLPTNGDHGFCAWTCRTNGHRGSNANPPALNPLTLYSLTNNWQPPQLHNVVGEDGKWTPPGGTRTAQILSAAVIDGAAEKR